MTHTYSLCQKRRKKRCYGVCVSISKMTDNVVVFPRTVEHIERDMERLADQSLDIQQRSEALLRWAEWMLNTAANDNES